MNARFFGWLHMESRARALVRLLKSCLPLPLRFSHDGRVDLEGTDTREKMG